MREKNSDITTTAIEQSFSAREIIANLRTQQQASETTGDIVIKDDQNGEKKNRKLKTIRKKIQQTIGLEYQIALVINSLGGDAGEISGIQNQEIYINHDKNIYRHAEQVSNSFIEARQKIDNIVEEESGILGNLNITNSDEFIKNDLFNQTSEVKTYKEYLKQSKDVFDSNVDLQKKIESFGVDIPDDENLSYTKLLASLKKVKQATRDKIMLLKNKTPEGKEEFSNYLENEINEAEVMNYKTEITRDSILFYKDNTYESYQKAMNENCISLYPETYNGKASNLKKDLIDIVKFEKLSQRFGKDTVKKAISRLLAQKAVNLIYSLNIKEDTSVENFLDKTNPKKIEENKKRLSDFSQNEVQELYKVLKDKSDFLKDNDFFESLSSFFAKNFYELDKTKNKTKYIQDNDIEPYNLEFCQYLLDTTNNRPLDNDIFKELLENKIKETKELTVAISEAQNIIDLSKIKEKYFSKYGEYLKSTIPLKLEKNQKLTDEFNFAHIHMNMGRPHNLNINFKRETMRNKILTQINNNKKNRDEISRKIAKIIETNLDSQI